MPAQLVTALVLALVASPSADEVERLAEAASQAREAGRLTESLHLLQEAWAEEPLPVLLNNIGRALEELGRYAEAADAYRRVVDDPRAPSELRDRDRARLDALAPKLARAWVQLEGALAVGPILVDGRPVVPAPLPEQRAELDLEPGPHVLERSTDPREVTILAVTAAPGTIVLDASAASATLELPLARVRVAHLTVDGYPVRAALLELEHVHLTPGPRQLTLETDDQRTLTTLRDLHPGERLQVAALLLEAQPPLPGEVERRQLITPAPPASRVPWTPWLLAASGVVAATVGVVLEGSAASDRQRVRDALAAGPVVRDLTFAEADALERGADTKATIGALVLGTGGAALVAGVAWWLLADESTE